MKRMLLRDSRRGLGARRSRPQLLGWVGGLALVLTLGLAPVAAAAPAATPFTWAGANSAGPGPGQSTTAVAASPTTVVTNQPVTLTATVTASTGVPTGTVSFSSPQGQISGCGARPVSGSGDTGTATCTTTLAPSEAGSGQSGVQVNAAYSPDSSSGVGGSATTSPATVTVNPAATTATLSIAPASVAVGQPVTYTATVTPSSGPGYGTEQPRGTVRFMDSSGTVPCGAQPLSGTSPDTATCTTAFSAAGSHLILAQYQPASPPGPDFTASSSSPQGVTVTGTSTTGPPGFPGTGPTRPTPKPRPKPTPRPVVVTPPCTQVAAARSAHNPLALSASPGPDPLHGAPFFVDGPSHGNAAGEIARLLGIDQSVPIGNFLPAFPDSESWAQFLSTTVAQKLPSASAAVRRQVLLLEKMAVEPEAQRISVFSEGGSPSGIAAFTDKLLCHNLTADPGTIPIITTYLMHPVLGGCSSSAKIEAYMPLFKQRVNAIVTGTGRRRVVYLLELDAVGSSSCMALHGSLGAWEKMLRYEVDQMATLPHAVVYVEGGYSDANGPKYAARMLNAVDIKRIRGFFTNDTHINWTINEIKYGNAISRMTHGTHFIVNTAENGNGPLLNPHPTTQGVENLCNPPGRGLGPAPTTTTGYPKVDAFLWTFPPGNSSGPCNGGPASGAWWPARAIQLAAAANNRLGPGFPSRPY
jgi:hypothetical protein